MWITPTCSQAVDNIARVFECAEEKQKKVGLIFSLDGKREKIRDVAEKVARYISGGEVQFEHRLYVWFDMMQVGLRELHTKPLVTRPDKELCQQIFFGYWVLPLFDAITQEAMAFQPQGLLTDVNALLQDYYDGEPQSADAFLNKKISRLLPHKKCPHFKQQLHKQKKRSSFSLQENHYRAALNDITQELTVNGLSQTEINDCMVKLRATFKAGAVLRRMVKWCGIFHSEHRLSRQQRSEITRKLRRFSPWVTLYPAKLAMCFSAEMAQYTCAMAGAGSDEEVVQRDISQLSREDIERYWPALLQREVDAVLEYCDHGCYLEDIYDFCAEYAPDSLLSAINKRHIVTQKQAAEKLFQSGERQELEKANDLLQKDIFTALKKMLVELNRQRQLGFYGTQLASMLMSFALTSRSRLTEHELTPLMNILIDNLSTDNALFPNYPFVTPFGSTECATVGQPFAAGDAIEKDDVAQINAMAMREYNQRLYRQIGCSQFLAYPFHNLERLLSAIFAAERIDQQVIDAVFRKEKIRRTISDKGNPCWRISDATPYVILRNLEMYLYLLGLDHQGVSMLTPAMEQYHLLPDSEKRYLLRAIDPEAYRHDLKLWWAAKKARHHHQAVYQADGEYFTRVG